jgi:hypothetical protein
MQNTEPASRANCWPCMILGTIIFAALVGLVIWGIYKLFA